MEIKRIKPLSKRWKALACELALSSVPNIFACGKCNYPVMKGYCCNFCKDSDPDRDKKGNIVSDNFYW